MKLDPKALTAAAKLLRDCAEYYSSDYGYDKASKCLRSAEALEAAALPQSQDIRELVEELLAACVGHPHAKIAWPHRLLHRAADALSCLAREGWRPKVKPLDWPDSIKQGRRVGSAGGLVCYTIAHYGGSEPDSGVVYRWAAEGESWSGPLFSYEQAIRAAQADYDRRILSALDLPAPSVEEKLP